jgi:hypothetical protein
MEKFAAADYVRGIQILKRRDERSFSISRSIVKITK